MRKHLARYGEWWWVPILYTLAVWWIYRDLWHQHDHASGLGWDAIDSYGPDLQYQSDDLASGHYSLWNPYDKGGYPLVGDPQYDRYYPFSWPFVAWGALFGPSWWLIQIKILAHHVVAAATMHLFLRTRGLGVRASIVGGFALIACSPLLGHKASNILWPLAWVPLVWVAIDAAMARPSWRRGAGMAAAFTLCVTAGSPPGLFYAGLLVASYGAWRFVGAMLEPDKRTREMVICLATTAALVALVIALTTVPAQALVQLGSRWRWQPERQFPLALSLPWAESIRGVMARGAGLGEMYMGAMVCMLAACAVVVRPRFDTNIVVLFAIVAAIGVELCAGENARLLPWLVEHLPGFGLLRIPGRYKLVAAWPIAAAAGYGIAALDSASGRARIRALACAAAVTAIVVAMVELRPEDNTPRAVWWSIVAILVAAAMVTAVVMAPQRWRWAVVSAVAIAVLVDAPWFTHTPELPPVADARQLHERDDAILARLPGVSDRWRLYDEFVLAERVGTRRRVRDFRGYPAVDPLSQLRYVDVLEVARKNPEILAEFNVRWVLWGMHFRHADQLSFVRMPSPSFELRGQGIFEARNPAPLVMWYGAITVEKPRAVLEKMIEIGAAGRDRAVVEPAEAIRLPAELASRPGEAHAGELESYDTDEIAATIDAPRDGVVVLNELAFPGWEVEVDGDAAPPLRANYLLRTVYVTAGHHRIVWSFHPAYYRLLVDGYLAALVVMLVAFATRKRSLRELARAVIHARRSSRRSKGPRSPQDA